PSRVPRRDSYAHVLADSNAPLVEDDCGYSLAAAAPSGATPHHRQSRGALRSCERGEGTARPRAVPPQAVPAGGAGGGVFGSADGGLEDQPEALRGRNKGRGLTGSTQGRA